MKYYFKPNILLIMIALIVGWAFLKEFNFMNFRFDDTALGIVYFLTFLSSIIMMIKKRPKGDS